MKNILLLIGIVLVQLTVTAQSKFQGTIKYSWEFSGEGVESFGFMMPTGTTLITSKFGSRLGFEGGMMSEMMGEFVYNTKKKKSYTIKVDQKTASELPAEEEEAKAEPTITKEDEIITILGHACQKYLITTTQDGVESTQQVWTTNDISIYDSGNNASMALGGAAKIEGFPMKVMVEQGGITMIMTVTELNPGSPSKALFSVPKDYTMEPYDPSGGFGM